MNNPPRHESGKDNSGGKEGIIGEKDDFGAVLTFQHYPLNFTPGSTPETPTNLGVGS